MISISDMAFLSQYSRDQGYMNELMNIEYFSWVLGLNILN